MCGFVRTISFKWTGDYIVTMGNFNEKEERHGYFRIYHTTPTTNEFGVKECYFQNGQPVEKTDKLKGKIKFDLYL